MHFLCHIPHSLSMHFWQFLDDLACPVEYSQKLSVVDWLLAHAIRLEYAENGLFYTFFHTFV